MASLVDLPKAMLFVFSRDIIQSAVIPAVAENWRITVCIARRATRKRVHRRLPKLIVERDTWKKTIKTWSWKYFDN